MIASQFRLSRIVVLVAGMAFCLDACTVGPDFHTPPSPQVALTPPALPSDATQVFAGADVPVRWWTMFGSADLDRLVAAAVRDNPDLDSARAAMRVAEENARAASGALYPALSASYSASRARDATGAVAPTAASGDATYSLHSAQLSLFYTLDLLGGTRRQIEALRAQANAQKYAVALSYVGLTANVVRAAITEAALRAQSDATARLIATEVEALRILRRQLAAGQIAELDVIAQEAILGQAQQALAANQRQLALQHNVLIALAGKMDDTVGPIPELGGILLPARLPLSVPAQLVSRRADIQAATETLHAASAGIGVARANMLPNISLSAAWGSTANDAGALFTPGSVLWNVAGGAVQPIFQGGALRHKSRAAVAGYDQAFAQYRGVVIAAFHDVRDALAGIETDLPAATAAAASERAAGETLRIATRQLAVGQTGYLSLLSAEQSYQQAASARIQADAARLLDTVALFQALGGDWQTDDPLASLEKSAS